MPTAVGTRDEAPRPKSRPLAGSKPRTAGWKRDRQRDRPRGLLSAWDRLRRLAWSWWPWAVLSVWAVVDTPSGWVAILFGAVAILAYLAAPPAEPPHYGLDHELSVAEPGFRRTMAGASGSLFVDGNTLEILNNGDAFYPAMLEAIREAQASITIEAYIYWAGEIGRAFAEALAGQATAGLPVKILLDAIGSAQIGADILAILEDGGCQVAWYNPIRWYTLGRFNNRTHRKSLIVDGRIAFTGGAGIADHWRGDARNPSEWRDIQIRLEGPAVVPLQTGFAHNWQQTTGELVTGDAFYPAIEPVGSLAAQTLLSSPEAGASSVRTMYYLSIASARESVFIANPYFIPDSVAIDLLIEARGRGVDVRIMVSGRRNDNWLARQNSVRLFGPLLRAGIEIQEFNRTMLHHKTMVVDRQWVTIGTTNFDNRSFAHNEESNVCCFDPALAAQLHEIFLEDVGGCERVMLKDWQRRGLRARTQELVASFLQEQA
jgi:cardiolipin synthase A/B